MKTLQSLLQETYLPEASLSEMELCAEIRSMIASEFEAIELYTTFMARIENQEVRDVLGKVIEEERIHVGEFQALLFSIDPKEKELYDRGAAEVAGGEDVTV